MYLKGIIGVIHLAPLPGDPAYAGEGGFAAAQQRALADARAWVVGGASALLLENFGSAPFVKGTAGHRLPPHQVAALALAAAACKELGVPVGVNCLRNDVLAALGIAAAADLDFVRVNVHTGAYVTDQGIIEGEADVSLRYRAQLGAQRVKILADCLVKHAQPLVPLDPIAAAQDCVQRGMADALVVTGKATGAPIDINLLQQIRQAVGGRPIYLGSGVTPEAANTLAPLAHGAIVGTWAKQDGALHMPVDVARVRILSAALKNAFMS